MDTMTHSLISDDYVLSLLPLFLVGIQYIVNGYGSMCYTEKLVMNVNTKQYIVYSAMSRMLYLYKYVKDVFKQLYT